MCVCVLCRTPCSLDAVDTQRLVAAVPFASAPFVHRTEKRRLFFGVSFPLMNTHRLAQGIAAPLCTARTTISGRNCQIKISFRLSDRQTEYRNQTHNGFFSETRNIFQFVENN